VDHPGPKLILASASPQRRAILTQAGVRFEVMPAGVEEESSGDPRQVAAENARRKALAVSPGEHVVGAENARRKAAAVPGALVLGADTLVAVDGAILGKPRDAAQAREYVARLAGRTHEVVGGVAVARDGAVVAEHLEVTRVEFRPLTPPQVAEYVATGEWEGRAGGYAIQGRGAPLVRRIEGDYFNVVGLPVAAVFDLLGVF
jgi:septum formation protein